MFDSNNAVTTNAANAVTAVVTHFGGGSEKFELIDLNPDPNITDIAGRLVLRKDREGRQLQVNYKTWTPAEISASPTRQWQIDTVTDSFANTLTFTYAATQYSGRWCVSQVTRQDAKSVSFNYANNKLSSVVFADSTSTTYSYSQDVNNDTTVVTTTEAMNPKRSGVYQLANDYTSGTQTGTLGFRIPGKPLEQASLGGELLWRRVLPIDASDDMEMIITGASAKVVTGIGTRRNVDAFQESAGGPPGAMNLRNAKTRYVAANNFIALFIGYDVTMDSVIYGASATQAQVDKRQIPLVTDEQGRQKSFIYDANGNTTKVTYVADGTYEEYAYNIFTDHPPAQPQWKRDGKYV